ncbi:NAD(P)/FAD-dependent oxidoreductase [Vallitalea okinawensis]|uniref:NAD(P)/FAD-dependent oxidoreductase n=1 Tax=Vallitalea okinawensis TaxID=2078660 RepID=UPI000CFB9212|nr:FAD-dependent oxidoreductase [Vallitalea okinawensis]
MKKQYIIIGNGIAGVTAASVIRELDHKCHIYLIGEEQYKPYNRMRLSKGILQNLNETNTRLKKEEWYDEQKIHLICDKKVDNVDPINKCVYLEDESSLTYNGLLIASGANNRELTIHGQKKGTHTIRRLEDLNQAKDDLEKAENILIVGGGIQGLEMAWELSKGNKHVIIVEKSSNLMPKQLDSEAAKRIEEKCKSHNIELLLGTSIDSIFGENQVTSFTTNTGKSYNADMIIYAIGIKANVPHFKNIELKTKEGVQVNDRMMTNIDHVFAAGDVAEYNGHIFGLWNIAMEQAKVAAHNMVGHESLYNPPTPVTTMNAFNLPLFSMGVINKSDSDEDVIDYSKDQYHRILLKDHQIIGAISIGDIKHSPVLKKAIERKRIINNSDDVSFNDLLQILKESK